MDLPANLLGKRDLTAHVYLFRDEYETNGMSVERPEGHDWAWSPWSVTFGNRQFAATREEATHAAVHWLRQHGPGKLVVHDESGEVYERDVELYEDIRLKGGPRARPSDLAERQVA